MDSSAAHNVAALLARTASVWPRLPALAAGSRICCDYATLAERVARLAGGLVASGSRPGDRVMLAARNVPAYIETLLACWWAGLVAVPVNAKLHPDEVAYLMDDSGATWLFADAAWANAIVDSSAQVVALGSEAYARLLTASPLPSPWPVARNDAAWLFYTSGTTGRPKGVVITHRNLHAMTMAFLVDVEAVAPGDAIVHAAPLSHGSGLYVLPHIARAAVQVVPASGGFDPAEIADLVGCFDRALFFAAPTMVKRLVDSPVLARFPLERLKCIVYGGGPMYVADARAAFAALGPRLAQIYGQGETPMTITAMDRAMLADAIARDDDRRLGSVGVAQSGMQIRIADAFDFALGPGETGEILVRGPTVMREYWGNPQASAATLAQGWLHTGDVGVLDADGYLTLKDRSKDLVISGGTNIYPREVEEALLRHPDVAEVAVIGRPHAQWGEEVVACVLPGTALADEAAVRRFEAVLDAHCLATIARFKRPRVYVIVEELPKNNTGKVLKTVLRERYGSAPA